MKKYKMAVGNCGPRILYTNIINAETPEDAARIYLGYKGIEEDISKVAARMFEVEDRTTRNEDECFVDAVGADIEIGKDIAFISRQDKNVIRMGKVDAVTKNTVSVISDDKRYRLISDPEDGRTIRKGIIISWKKGRASKDAYQDALGQALKVGSFVACRKEVDLNNCKGFSFGTITKVTGTFVFVCDIETEKEIRRRHDLVIVIKNS